MPTPSHSKIDILLKSLKTGRVYRATKNGNLFYRIEQVQHDNKLIVVSSLNPSPDLQRQRMHRRALLAATMSTYDLEIVPLDSEPPELMSKEGTELAKRKKQEECAAKSQIQSQILAEDAAKIVADLLDAGVQLNVISGKIHSREPRPGMLLKEHMPAIMALKPVIVALTKQRPAWLESMERDVATTKKMVENLLDGLGVSKDSEAAQ